MNKRLTPQQSTKVRRHSRQRTKKISGFLFMLPCFLILFLFVVYPLGHTLYLSFCEYNFAFDPGPVFKGMTNYVNMFQDSKFLISVTNTLKFAFVDFILMMVISLLLALLLFFKGRNTWFFRTSIFMPIVVPASLVCIIFTWLLSKDFGLLNKFLVDGLGLPQLAKPWLTSEDTALWSLLSVNLWCNIGFETILFLSGLQSISPDILEAADMDGATGFRKIIHIILPNLSQTYIITGIWATVAALKVFVEPMVMTNGGPGSSTLVLYMYIYNNAFKYYDLGYAAAMAFFLSAMILLVSLINFRLNNRKG